MRGIRRIVSAPTNKQSTREITETVTLRSEGIPPRDKKVFKTKQAKKTQAAACDNLHNQTATQHKTKKQNTTNRTICWLLCIGGFSQ
jgi:cbb3-type cytochrome oxidase cytochrome c subunit